MAIFSSDVEKGAKQSAVDEHGYDNSLRGHDLNRPESIGAGELAEDGHGITQHELKSLHAQMIALGGTIGTGLFVGAGQTLATRGPAYILAGYIIVSLLVWCVVTANTEVAAHLPVHRASMSYYGTRYVSRSLGFALGYLYWYALGILIPYELTASALVINYWPNPVHNGVWITIMLVVIVGLNFLPACISSREWFEV